MSLIKKVLIASLTASLVIGCSPKEQTTKPDDMVKDAGTVESQNTDSTIDEEVVAAEEAAREAEAAEAKAKAEAQKAAAAAAKAEAEEMAKRAAEEAAAEAAKEAEMQAAAAAKAEAKAEAEKMVAKQEDAKAAAKKAAMEAEEAAKAEAARLAAEQEAAAKAEAERVAAELAAKEAAAKAEAEAAAKAKAAAAAQSAAAVTKPKQVNIDSSDLTPVGAQRSGNADGTIPPWTGGITSPPAGYKIGDHHQDPFASDKVLFTINASNYQQYSDKLTVGQKAMFDKYPDTYKMDVYKTRRSASFPQRTYEMTQKNAGTAKLIAGGEGIADAAEGFPFPNPSNAYEAIFNHKLKYKGVGGVRYNNQVAPTVNGKYTVVKLKEENLGYYYKPGATLEDTNNILLYFYQVVESPARLAGRILLVHETMNQIETPRQAWIYNPGQRRVRRAPNVAYDNPGTASDGLRTNDMTDMFNGAMDRFDWELLGKKEMYVPYNSYKVHSGDLDYDDMVRPGHLNADLMRYELHRVWVVEAKLKDGLRHINSRRTFYLDEDSYQILLVDHYDRRGDLWRFSEAHCINYYEVPTFWSTIETHHDLRSGRYIALGLDNKDPVNTYDSPLDAANYTPNALRQRGRR